MSHRKMLTPQDVALLEACEAGDAERVRHALVEGADPQARKRITLVCDVRSGTRSVGKVVVKRNLFRRDVVEERVEDTYEHLMDVCQGESALALAVIHASSSSSSSSSTDIVSALLDAGADPDTPIEWQVADTVDGWTLDRWRASRWAKTYSFESAVMLAIGRGGKVAEHDGGDEAQAGAGKGFVRVNKKGGMVPLRNPAVPDDAWTEVRLTAQLDTINLLVDRGARITPDLLRMARQMQEEHSVEEQASRASPQVSAAGSGQGSVSVSTSGHGNGNGNGPGVARGNGHGQVPPSAEDIYSPPSSPPASIRDLPKHYTSDSTTTPQPSPTSSPLVVPSYLHAHSSQQHTWRRSTTGSDIGFPTPSTTLRSHLSPHTPTRPLSATHPHPTPEAAGGDPSLTRLFVSQIQANDELRRDVRNLRGLADELARRLKVVEARLAESRAECDGLHRANTHLRGQVLALRQNPGANGFAPRTLTLTRGVGAPGETTTTTTVKQIFHVVGEFAPREEDELALQFGQEVFCTVLFEDGWGAGLNLTTTIFGLFPMSCLSPIPAPAPAEVFFNRRVDSLPNHVPDRDNQETPLSPLSPTERSPRSQHSPLLMPGDITHGIASAAAESAAAGTLSPPTKHASLPRKIPSARSLSQAPPPGRNPGSPPMTRRSVDFSIGGAGGLAGGGVALDGFGGGGPGGNQGSVSVMGVEEAKLRGLLVAMGS